MAGRRYLKLYAMVFCWLVCSRSGFTAGHLGFCFLNGE